MRKRLTQINIIILLCAFVLSFAKNAYPQQDVLITEYEKLKKDYAALLADRDNLLAQAKNLLEYKSKSQEIEVRIKKAEEEKQQLQRELQAKTDQITQLQQKIADSEGTHNQLLQEKENLKNSLEKFEIEYKIVPETRKEIGRLQKENSELLKKYKQLEENLKKLEEKKIDAEAQAEVYHSQLKDFQKRYEEAMAKNRSLENKANDLPKRFAELARENKILIKQTALMHYNLGVFYTQNKEYSRAIAEFEKGLDLNPDDAYAHYNLGYIYAEYLVDRNKAIEHFRHFLRLSKVEDKDVDWVKKYILTWQTWEGKKPVQ
jgi:chromosome segregation ATPase